MCMYVHRPPPQNYILYLFTGYYVAMRRTPKPHRAINTHVCSSTTNMNQTYLLYNISQDDRSKRLINDGVKKAEAFKKKFFFHTNNIDGQNMYWYRR